MFRDIYEEADWILGQIRDFKERLDEVHSKAEEELALIRKKYEPEVKLLQNNIRQMEKRLKEICKKQKPVLFAETDRVELKNGAILYHAQWKVKRVRAVLKKLKELGLTEAIKTTESVKWDVLEKWPDEKLFVVGTEKVLKEDFTYELRKEKEGDKRHYRKRKN